ncbi:Hypothetical protein PHPALM_5843 [Phytophthora palmivora]|uniref:MULE transposase domain-containing protein n=1 Tax=Phytophthora palmivora TaxID=4796 RepID=A0A2P4YGF4_9STRA|nr:Hypothetical protein PHPALM_5843 [Phytophthora palmivora]
MADADKFQRNAVDSVLVVGNDRVNLMCYFHVAAKICKHTRGIPIVAKWFCEIARSQEFSCTLRPNYRLTEGVLRSSVKFLDLTLCTRPYESTVLKKLGLASPTQRVRYLLTSVWLNSNFLRWQAFHTPRGFAAANNPVEHFNRAIKRDYFLRARLKMGTLIDQLLLCVKTEGVRGRPIATGYGSTGARDDKTKTIRETTPIKTSIGCLTGAAQELAASTIVHVVSDTLQSVYYPQDRCTKEALPVTACLSAQKARMETAGMPATGWQIDAMHRRAAAACSSKSAVVSTSYTGYPCGIS